MIGYKIKATAFSSTLFWEANLSNSNYIFTRSAFKISALPINKHFASKRIGKRIVLRLE